MALTPGGAGHGDRRAAGVGPEARVSERRRMHPLLLAMWRWRVFWTLALLTIWTVALAVSFALPEELSARVLAGALALPLALPAAILLGQWSGAAGRLFAARLAVRRARATFRATLKMARRHPELVDLDRLREAAAALSRATAGDGRRFPEVDEASKHPYAPIRRAASSVLDAAQVHGGAERNSPTAS